MNVPLVPSLLAGMTLLVGGCAVVAVDDPYRDYHYGSPVVSIAPPPPRYEYIGVPPVVGHIWIDGYWDWGGSRYQWVPGRWESPRPGYHWSPFRWERHGNDWRRQGGRWEGGRDGGARPHMPAPGPQPRYDSERSGLPPVMSGRDRQRPLSTRDMPPLENPASRDERERNDGNRGALQHGREGRDGFRPERPSREGGRGFREERRP